MKMDADLRRVGKKGTANGRKTRGSMDEKKMEEMRRQEDGRRVIFGKSRDLRGK